MQVVVSITMANCREPTADELHAFNSLEDIFAWFGLQGNVHHAGSAPGALVRLLGVCPLPEGSVPTDAPERWLKLTDFANVDPDDYKDAL